MGGGAERGGCAPRLELLLFLGLCGRAAALRGKRGPQPVPARQVCSRSPEHRLLCCANPLSFKKKKKNPPHGIAVEGEAAVPRVGVGGIQPCGGKRGLGVDAARHCGLRAAEHPRECGACGAAGSAGGNRSCRGERRSRPEMMGLRDRGLFWQRENPTPGRQCECLRLGARTRGVIDVRARGPSPPLAWHLGIVSSDGAGHHASLDPGAAGCTECSLLLLRFYRATLQQAL